MKPGDIELLAALAALQLGHASGHKMVRIQPASFSGRPSIAVEDLGASRCGKTGSQTRFLEEADRCSG